jgi:ABC-type Fe3+/spermidine/putrescine transport system ATPase subunit
VLEVAGLRKTCPTGDRALEGVSFTVEGHDAVVILGPSGSGRSTLLRCINRLVEPDAGSARLDGREITRLAGSALRLARRAMGMIFQEFNLVERLTVMENALVFIIVVGPGSPAGVLAIAVRSIGFVAKLVAEEIAPAGLPRSTPSAVVWTGRLRALATRPGEAAPWSGCVGGTCTSQPWRRACACRMRRGSARSRSASSARRPRRSGPGAIGSRPTA